VDENMGGRTQDQRARYLGGKLRPINFSRWWEMADIGKNTI